MESRESPDQVLKKIMEFNDFMPEEWQAMISTCRWHRYGEGELVVEYQDESNGVFIVAQGVIRILYYSLSGREVVFSDIHAGDMFGELSAIDGQRRSATAIAKTESVLVSIPADKFMEIIYSNKSVALAILKRLSEKVRNLSDRLADVSTLSVKSRIHIELLRLATETDDKSNSATIYPAPTHAEIASRVSTHREAVTRELNYLWRCGLVEHKKRSLIIHDVEKLQYLVVRARGIISH